MNARKLLLFVALPILVILAILAIALSGHHKKIVKSPTTNSSTSSQKAATNSGSSGSDTTTSSNSATSTPATDNPTFDAISSQVSDGGAYQNGTFTILSTSEPVAGWVIAQVQPDGSSSGATVLLRRNDSGPMTVIAGPGTSFAKSILDQYSVPMAVQEQLLVYNDEQ